MAEKEQVIEKMREVAKDIITCKITRDMSHEQCMKKFYSIMRKHGIKQGEWTEGGGRTTNNFEWTMCFTLFRSVCHDQFLLSDLFGEGMPKDLRAYGPEPKYPKRLPKKKK